MGFLAQLTNATEQFLGSANLTSEVRRARVGLDIG